MAQQEKQPDKINEIANRVNLRADQKFLAWGRAKFFPKAQSEIVKEEVVREAPHHYGMNPAIETVETVKPDETPKKKKDTKDALAIVAVIGATLGAIGIMLNAGDNNYRQNGNNQFGVTEPATPTPSAAAGTPRPESVFIPIATATPKPEATKVVPTVAPTAIVEPTATRTPEPTPTPVEIVKTPNFGIKYNENTNTYALANKNTGESVDYSKLSFATLSYQETGIATTKTLKGSILPDQVAIVEGYKVNGKGDGVFEVITAGESIKEFEVKISDGAIRVVSVKDGPLALLKAYQNAINNNYAHQVFNIPNDWIVR